MKSSAKRRFLAQVARFPQLIAWGPVRHSQGYLVPYYFNFRAAPSLPKLREHVVRALVREVRRLRVDVVVGAETAGMAWAALVADRLGKPFAYVRKKRKPALDRRAVEGIYRAGTRAVLIDDTVLLGETKKSMVREALRDGLEVTHVLLIYGGTPRQATWRKLTLWLRQRGVRLTMLVTKDELSRAFTERGIITPELIELNALYMADPYGWHKTRSARRLLPQLKQARSRYAPTR